jgi:hypothetical protein
MVRHVTWDGMGSEGDVIGWCSPGTLVRRNGLGWDGMGWPPDGLSGS